MIKKLIEERLLTLAPIELTVTDQSHLHQGHAGNNGGGHFTVAISSNEFTGKSLMERHRLVYQLMHDLIPEKIHALSIKAISPDD